MHIRGLDNLDNAALRNYLSTHFDSPQFQKIEWIDDTSANFVYNTASAASEALIAFTNTDVVDISQLDTLALRPAKPLQVTRDGGAVEAYELQIRQATTSDVKKRGAHESSRFYLMNPEKDPREQRNKERRERIHRNVENGDYRRMHFDDRERKRRREEETFDESMYDDDAGAGTGTGTGSGRAASASDDDRRKKVRFGRRRDQRDLFETRRDGRLRDRSASPMRGDGDGRFGFGTDADAMDYQRHRNARQRSFSPRPSRDRNINLTANNNAGKELFATKTTLDPAANIELFPHKHSSSSSGMLNSNGGHSHSSSMELFPDKVRKSHHRRSGAIDASPDRFAPGGPERPRSLAERITGGSSLADRISGGGGGSLADRITPRGGSLADRITREDEDSGISIRGNSGLSIKGRAGDASDNFAVKGASGVKELFPVKAASGGNAGKELFGEKLKGRGGARRTAASYY